ncbi:uncharacterized protein LOC108674048 [Hyalella azteca]|uniref:Uncharacterized protein LOC108674048 n=1 Tax=Hyalella azteca TaxID=294128 RepID=A0A8B7NX24_HYAAZ|nr:uncharacterized protein LOC108674048 [Hyalella azteca]
MSALKEKLLDMRLQQRPVTSALLMLVVLLLLLAISCLFLRFEEQEIEDRILFSDDKIQHLAEDQQNNREKEGSVVVKEAPETRVSDGGSTEKLSGQRKEEIKYLGGREAVVSGTNVLDRGIFNTRADISNDHRNPLLTSDQGFPLGDTFFGNETTDNNPLFIQHDPLPPSQDDRTESNEPEDTGNPGLILYLEEPGMHVKIPDSAWTSSGVQLSDIEIMESGAEVVSPVLRLSVLDPILSQIKVLDGRERKGRTTNLASLHSSTRIRLNADDYRKLLHQQGSEKYESGYQDKDDLVQTVTDDDSLLVAWAPENDSLHDSNQNDRVHSLSHKTAAVTESYLEVKQLDEAEEKSRKGVGGTAASTTENSEIYHRKAANDLSSEVRIVKSESDSSGNTSHPEGFSTKAVVRRGLLLPEVKSRRKRALTFFRISGGGARHLRDVPLGPLPPPSDYTPSYGIRNSTVNPEMKRQRLNQILSGVNEEALPKIQPLLLPSSNTSMFLPDMLNLTLPTLPPLIDPKELADFFTIPPIEEWFKIPNKTSTINWTLPDPDPLKLFAHFTSTSAPVLELADSSPSDLGTTEKTIDPSRLFSLMRGEISATDGGLLSAFQNVMKNGDIAALQSAMELNTNQSAASNSSAVDIFEALRLKFSPQSEEETTSSDGLEFFRNITNFFNNKNVSNFQDTSIQNVSDSQTVSNMESVIGIKLGGLLANKNSSDAMMNTLKSVFPQLSEMPNATTLSLLPGLSTIAAAMKSATNSSSYDEKGNTTEQSSALPVELSFEHFLAKFTPAPETSSPSSSAATVTPASQFDSGLQSSTVKSVTNSDFSNLFSGNGQTASPPIDFLSFFRGQPNSVSMSAQIDKNTMASVNQMVKNALGAGSETMSPSIAGLLSNTNTRTMKNMLDAIMKTTGVQYENNKPINNQLQGFLDGFSTPSLSVEPNLVVTKPLPTNPLDFSNLFGINANKPSLNEASGANPALPSRGYLPPLIGMQSSVQMQNGYQDMSALLSNAFRKSLLISPALHSLAPGNRQNIFGLPSLQLDSNAKSLTNSDNLGRMDTRAQSNADGSNKSLKNDHDDIPQDDSASDMLSNLDGNINGLRRMMFLPFSSHHHGSERNRRSDSVNLFGSVNSNTFHHNRPGHPMKGPSVEEVRPLLSFSANDKEASHLLRLSNERGNNGHHFIEKSPQTEAGIQRPANLFQHGRNTQTYLNNLNNISPSKFNDLMSAGMSQEVLQNMLRVMRLAQLQRPTRTEFASHNVPIYPAVRYSRTKDQNDGTPLNIRVGRTLFGNDATTSTTPDPTLPQNVSLWPFPTYSKTSTTPIPTTSTSTPAPFTFPTLPPFTFPTLPSLPTLPPITTLPPPAASNTTEDGFSAFLGEQATKMSSFFERMSNFSVDAVTVLRDTGTVVTALGSAASRTINAFVDVAQLLEPVTNLIARKIQESENEGKTTTTTEQPRSYNAYQRPRPLPDNSVYFQ